MVESALFTELGKEQGAAKALKGIQPITCVDGVRLHMKTALFASRSIREDLPCQGTTSQFPFAKMKLELTGENPGDATDRIERHYVAFLGEARPRGRPGCAV